MPRLAANLSTLFLERPFFDRFAAAAAAGFRAVEFYYPYALDPVELSDVLSRHDLAQVLFNTAKRRVGDVEQGLACVPGRQEEFRETIGDAIRYANALACRSVHVVAGVIPPGVDRRLAYDTCVHNLAYAAEQFGRHGVKALIEPLNPRDAPGFILTSPAMAVSLIRDAGVPNLYLQYDVYHAQIVEGDLARSIERYLPHIAHIQIADVPDRHEPGTGEIHYPFLFNLLDALGYGGWVGCEYYPLRDTESGLGWADDYLARPSARRGAGMGSGGRFTSVRPPRPDGGARRRSRSQGVDVATAVESDPRCRAGTGRR
jgi:hydroxypyruvate isomerase